MEEDESDILIRVRTICIGEMNQGFKSGFVNIIGLPNAGKSTLLNALSGDKMAITSPKPQTTRQRVLSIINSQVYQIIFSDNPGWIERTAYSLHYAMNKQVLTSGEDADIFILLIDALHPNADIAPLLNLLKKYDKPCIACLNKADIAPSANMDAIRLSLSKIDNIDQVIEISALKQTGISQIFDFVVEHLPVHPAFYPAEVLSDKPIRFFIAELIREQIFYMFDDEIPYSCFVAVDQCKGVDEQEPTARIEATIYVNRQSHLAILIGKNGTMIKALGIESRKSIEKYLKQKVYLNLSVKLKKNWRDNVSFLTKTGIYQ